MLVFDVVIVGAGPAGLSAAIRLKQLKNNLRVCVVEKGSEVGAHILSGAVLEPHALNELIPEWQKLDNPLKTSVTEDKFIYLTEQNFFSLPTPPLMRNTNQNYIISLGNFCRWLAQQAENLGVEIYPGFAATTILFDNNGKVCGIATGDMGIDKNGKPTERFQSGVELHAAQTFFAEGCRGSLTKHIINRFSLDRDCDPQTYAIGVKELWEIDAKQHQLGKVIHTIGWPLNNQTYGGSFIYHLENNQVAIGFVTGLDYQNTYLDPFQELQRFKTHPAVRDLFANGRRIAYGARALVEGGIQSQPKLSFPGGLLIGDTAGFLNVPKIKGTHTAMKSGMIAAETFVESLNKTSEDELGSYTNNIKKSWLWQELYQVRNIRPAFKRGLWPGLLYSAIDCYLFRGKAPWTFKNHADYRQLKPAKKCQKINYPKPDGIITFDKLSSVYLSNTHHEENQPCHLQLKQPQLAITSNLAIYDSPETRYCPANVYEIVTDENQQPRLQINAQNCIHCKTCDIKDPGQNINWIAPEGGNGPNYPNM